MIKQAKLTYSPLGKGLEKQIKTIEDHGKNRCLKTIKPDDQKLTVQDKIPEGQFSEKNSKKNPKNPEIIEIEKIQLIKNELRKFAICRNNRYMQFLTI